MSETIQSGALYVVGTPIGNLDDISLRAIRILGSVDIIAAEDTRTTRVLLKHLSIDKPLISHHSYNETRRAPEILGMLRLGKSVAVVSDAGTPGISDPASLIIRRALAEGIPVIPIPGASAILPALLLSGLPTDRFVFEGFLPVKKGRRTRLESLRHEPRTIILYESPGRVERTLRDLLETMGDREVAVVREITKKFEESLRGTIAEVLRRIKEKPPRGEHVVVVAGTRTRKGSVEEVGDVADKNGF